MPDYCAGRGRGLRRSLAGFQSIPGRKSACCPAESRRPSHAGRRPVWTARTAATSNRSASLSGLPGIRAPLAGKRWPAAPACCRRTSCRRGIAPRSGPGNAGCRSRRPRISPLCPLSKPRTASRWRSLSPRPSACSPRGTSSPAASFGALFSANRPCSILSRAWSAAPSRFSSSGARFSPEIDFWKPLEKFSMSTSPACDAVRAELLLENLAELEAESEARVRLDHGGIRRQGQFRFFRGGVTCGAAEAGAGAAFSWAGAAIAAAASTGSIMRCFRIRDFRADAHGVKPPFW